MTVGGAVETPCDRTARFVHTPLDRSGLELARRRPLKACAADIGLPHIVALKRHKQCDAAPAEDRQVPHSEQGRPAAIQLLKRGREASHGGRARNDRAWEQRLAEVVVHDVVGTREDMREQAEPERLEPRAIGQRRRQPEDDLSAS